MNLHIEKLQQLSTPYYYYDTDLLVATLAEVKSHLTSDFHVHYAVKANANPTILRHICKAGLGCDCVSGGEIEACLRAGFSADKIVYAGVGKADWEINLGLDAGIFCFNCESTEELAIINELAAAKNKVARVALRINPNVGAHTHANITTGLAENKFGIAMEDMEQVIGLCEAASHIEFV